MSEQLRTVGMSLRRELAALGGLLALVTVGVISVATRQPWRDLTVSLTPGMLTPMVLLAGLLPLAVWKSEGPGQRGYHRAMPVDPALHALAKAFAGWSWLLAALGGYLVWGVLLMTGTGGGSYLGWRWLAPFAAAGILYAVVTALSLVARHPWRWVAGLAVGYAAISSLAYAMPALRPLEDLMDALLEGPYGIQTVLSGREAGHWPMAFSAWLGITAVWAAGAGATLFAALRRIPEE